MFWFAWRLRQLENELHYVNKCATEDFVESWNDLDSAMQDLGYRYVLEHNKFVRIDDEKPVNVPVAWVTSGSAHDDGNSGKSDLP